MVTFQKEAVHVDTLGRRLGDVLLVVARDLILQDHRVEGPALVGTGHFLDGVNIVFRLNHIVSHQISILINTLPTSEIH